MTAAKTQSVRVRDKEDIPKGSDLKLFFSPATHNLSIYHQELLDKIVYSIKDQRKRPHFSKKQALERAIEVYAKIVEKHGITIKPVPEDAVRASNNLRASIRRGKSKVVNPEKAVAENSDTFTEIDLF